MPKQTRRRKYTRRKGKRGGGIDSIVRHVKQNLGMPTITTATLESKAKAKAEAEAKAKATKADTFQMVENPLIKQIQKQEYKAAKNLKEDIINSNTEVDNYTLPNRDNKRKHFTPVISVPIGENNGTSNVGGIDEGATELNDGNFKSKGLYGQTLSHWEDGTPRIYIWNGKSYERPKKSGGKTRRKRRRRYTKK